VLCLSSAAQHAAPERKCPTKLFRESRSINDTSATSLSVSSNFGGFGNAWCLAIPLEQVGQPSCHITDESRFPHCPRTGLHSGQPLAFTLR